MLWVRIIEVDVRAFDSRLKSYSLAVVLICVVCLCKSIVGDKTKLNVNLNAKLMCDWSSKYGTDFIGEYMQIAFRKRFSHRFKTHKCR